ncbi:XRE family transcriptional regulator [Erwinia sp. OLSSP12]|uniref:XRE family transcriptional regulator n=1 Tax=Erwinia sp. OLSSP12 TaxID=1912096 RepID=UPI000C1A2595|nr:XRE family transcriptional regulator [Erwinia sp. OLSSP12]PIJ68952.1 hypothetical protein BK416_15685 [Erwinia sp. OLSSP12]
MNNVQRATLTRIADFFGVSCEVIENHNLEHIELIEKTLSPDGNKNPAAVPVIPQSDLILSRERRIGYLAAHYPLTWFFGDVSNMVALLVEKNLNNMFYPGDILIIKRDCPAKMKQPALFYSAEKGIFIRENDDSVIHLCQEGETLLGVIVEERIQ